MPNCQIRYQEPKRGLWVVYSKHKTERVARRKFREACEKWPGCIVKLLVDTEKIEERLPEDLTNA